MAAIMNSDAIHEKVEPLMSEGLFGKRHVDKYVFAVPFPLFDPDQDLHTRIAETGARAEAVAAEVDFGDAGFTKARREVREGLDEDGVGGELEELIGELLAPVELKL
ncbi:MAG: hypothetical protein ACXWEK_03345 [Solirubrobacterales bacterium]